jgi:hypothetical protein
MCMVAKLLGYIAGILGDIWGVLNSVLSALGHLAADIAAAIMSALSGALTSLFVPGPNFFSDQMSGVSDAWNNTAPWKIFAGVGTVGSALNVPDPGGGCSGPPLTIANPVTHGSQTLHVFDSCSGGSATLATITRLALEVAVWVAAALLGLRVLLASVGVNLTVGQGGADA